MTESFSVLVLFAHPDRNDSRIHKALLHSIRNMAGVTLVDLYEEYPDFLIDVKREQERLAQHDLIIFQHPIYWYSCPPLLKEWMDCVLARGWAYGEDGQALRGKDFLQVISAGGPDTAYARGGGNRFTLYEFLRPFEATAHLCGLNYHEPFLVQGVRAIDSERIAERGRHYHDLLVRYQSEGRRVLIPLDTSHSHHP